MARRLRKMDTKKVQKWRKEGRGQGRGADYSPWYTIHDVASQGQAGRIDGHITGRTHHCLSKFESNYCCIVDLMSPLVVDIREQFPLFPMEETLMIADLCGVKHPADPQSKDYIPLTTDFVITVSNGQSTREIARTLKYASDLSNPRTIEKLEIERRYWEFREVDWKIVTPTEIPKGLAANCNHLHGFVDLSGHSLTDDEVQRIARELKKMILGSDRSLRHCATACDKALGYDDLGKSLVVAYHMIATRQWAVDLTVKINAGRRLNLLADGPNLSKEVM